MHKFILIFSCLLIAGIVHAQDNLILRNGDEISVKIIEINPTEIKYKKFDKPDGVLYVIRKSDAFMVKYPDGSKDVFKIEDHRSMALNPMQRGGPVKDFAYYNKKSKKNIITGAVLTAVGVPTFLLGVGAMASMNTYKGGYSYDMNSGAAGGLLMAGGLAMSIIGPIKLGRGLYFRKLARKAKPEFSMSPFMQPNTSAFSSGMNFSAGAGFKMKF